MWSVEFSLSAHHEISFVNSHHRTVFRRGSVLVLNELGRRATARRNRYAEMTKTKRQLTQAIGLVVLSVGLLSASSYRPAPGAVRKMSLRSPHSEPTVPELPTERYGIPGHHASYLIRPGSAMASSNAAVQTHGTGVSAKPTRRHAAALGMIGFGMLLFVSAIWLRRASSD